MSPELSSIHRLCQHVNARGHRCRMVAMPAQENARKEDQPRFCAYHSTQRAAKAAPPDPEAVARDLLRGVSSLADAASVNRFLANLLRQLAHRRIPRRDALALAYISQLLINTLGPLQKERDDLRGAEAGRILLEHVAQAREARLARQQSEEREASGKPS
jgi:hypothetical protein